VPEAVAGGLWERLLTAVGTSAPQHLRMHHSDDGGTWQWSEDLTLAPCADDLVVTLLRDATQEEHRLRDITQDRESAVHAAMHDALTGCRTAPDCSAGSRERSPPASPVTGSPSSSSTSTASRP
jgi:hypothetical protein